MTRRERQRLIGRLRQDARRIADQFGLEYRDIVPEHPRVKARYGVCYEDGLIKIRLNHVRTGESLKYSALVDTLVHELAHLRHFNHGPKFKDLYLRMLRWARGQGIYRPSPRSRRAPRRPFEAPLAGPATRGGVPVFHTPPALDPSRPPWEQLDLLLGAPPPPPPRRRRPPRPRTKRPRPQQLSLF
jgi:hypothetical protein